MYKLKGRALLNEDIIYPDIPYATFSDELTKTTVKSIVNNLNYGTEMLMVYKQYRDNLHITNVVELLTTLDKIYRTWDLLRYTNNNYNVEVRGVPQAAGTGGNDDYR